MAYFAIIPHFFNNNFDKYYKHIDDIYYYLHFLQIIKESEENNTRKWITGNKLNWLKRSLGLSPTSLFL